MVARRCKRTLTIGAFHAIEGYFGFWCVLSVLIVVKANVEVGCNRNVRIKTSPYRSRRLIHPRALTFAHIICIMYWTWTLTVSGCENSDGVTIFSNSRDANLILTPLISTLVQVDNDQFKHNSIQLNCAGVFHLQIVQILGKQNARRVLWYSKHVESYWHFSGCNYSTRHFHGQDSEKRTKLVDNPYSRCSRCLRSGNFYWSGIFPAA